METAESTLKKVDSEDLVILNELYFISSSDDLILNLKSTQEEVLTSLGETNEVR